MRTSGVTPLTQGLSSVIATIEKYIILIMCLVECVCGCVCVCVSDCGLTICLPD